MVKKETRTVARQIEDLPVEAEQAAEVKGGLNITRLAGSVVPDAPDKMTVPDAPARLLRGGV
jgi:hypothetical protein